MLFLLKWSSLRWWQNKTKLATFWNQSPHHPGLQRAQHSTLHNLYAHWSWIHPQLHTTQMSNPCRQSLAEEFVLQMFWLSPLQSTCTTATDGEPARRSFPENAVTSDLHQCRRGLPGFVCRRSLRCSSEDIQLLNHLFGNKSNYLEVSEDLSTDNCLTAIWSFTAWRGQPRLFLSDTGSNFLGSGKQIRRRPLMLDHEYIKDQLLNQSVEWKLNPLLHLTSLGCGRESFNLSNESFSWTSVPQN